MLLNLTSRQLTISAFWLLGFVCLQLPLKVSQSKYSGTSWLLFAEKEL